MYRCPAILVLVGALALPSGSASAQTLLDVWVAPLAGADVLARVEPEGPRVTSVRSLEADDRGWAVGWPTPEGRYMVGVTSESRPETGGLNVYYLSVRDLVASQTQQLYWAGESPSFALHSRRTEILTARQGSPLVLSAAGERRLASPDNSCGSLVGLSGDGTRALYRCAAVLRVFDIASGVMTGELPTALGPLAALSVDGQDVYEVLGMQLRRRSVVTGEVTAEVTIPDDVALSPDRLLVSDRSGEVFTVGRRIHVFDATTLELRRSRLVPWLTSGGSGATLESWTFDLEQPRLHAVAGSDGGPNSVPVLWTLDSETLAVQFQTPIPGRAAVARRVPRPAAPAGLAASVSGGAVTVTWSEGLLWGQPTRYVLEVGSAPGLSNIFSGLDVGPQQSFSTSGVPPGTYYVRVRAGNFAALSAPSNEIVVTVP